jgi:hypothetical protein
MKQDRFLIGILIFIGLLVVTALVLFFVRQDTPTYGPEDTPDGVVHNYAVAIQNGDYEKAYGYLADLENKPGYLYFQQGVVSYTSGTNNASLLIGTQHLSGDQAWVELTIVYAPTGPFSDGGWSNTEKATLVRQNGAWKLSYMPYPYWGGGDWYQQNMVPGKP